jgi:hypothetical protein
VDPDFLKQYNDQKKAMMPRAVHANINIAATCSVDCVCKVFVVFAEFAEFAVFVAFAV